jgi:uncharacterized protein (TIGR02001 family)
MNKTLFTSTVVGIFLNSAVANERASSEHMVSTNVGISSNYIWRGITQTDKKPAVSVGADYSHQSGFYAGTWLSNVDFSDDTNLELDLYSGYKTEINGADVDFGYIYYGYQGGDDNHFSEAYIKVSIDNLSLGVSTLVDSQWGDSVTDLTYFEGNYTFSLPSDLSLDLHAGYYDLKDAQNYRDFSIALSHISGLSLMVTTLEGNEALEDELISVSYNRSFDL